MSSLRKDVLLVDNVKAYTTKILEFFHPTKKKGVVTGVPLHRFEDSP